MGHDNNKMSTIPTVPPNCTITLHGGLRGSIPLTHYKNAVTEEAPHGNTSLQLYYSSISIPADTGTNGEDFANSIELRFRDRSFLQRNGATSATALIYTMSRLEE